jgi:predicted RND superfamily exporter protein
MNRFTAWIIRHTAPILLVGTLLSGVSLYYSVQLYKNLRTEIEELLPHTARSVVDMHEVTSRLESIDNLSVLVFSEDTEASKRFVIDLARELESVPKNVIASVEYNIAKELKWFEERRPLYMDLSDLKRIRDYIANKIDYEYTLYNPLTIFSEVEYREPRFDMQAMKMKYEGKVSSYSKFPDGYYATPDGKKRVVLVYKPGKKASVTELKKAVVQAIDRLSPKSYSQDLEIKYTGGVQNTIEEQAALVEDLEISTVIVTILVGLGLVFFFRSFWVMNALFIALFMGTFWTFGIAYFLIGYLNANSAFLGAIVLGNGINFPIIMVARYVEERRAGRDHAISLDQSIFNTTSATLTAALAAGLSYGSLALTSFRGFRQFGIIGLIGMICCWGAAYTILPAVLTWFEKRKLLDFSKPAAKSYIANSIASFVSNYAKSISWATLLLSIASLATFARYQPDILETDLKKLRNKESMTVGSGYLSMHVDEIFGRYLSPMVVLPHDRKDTLFIAEKLKAKKAQDGPDSLIAAVQTIDDFIPKDQEQKIKLLREIQDLLPPQILNRLPPHERKLAQNFIDSRIKKPITMGDLPQLVITKFTEKDRSVGKIILVEPPLGKATLNGDNLVRFIQEIREAADSIAPGTPVAGSLPISADMITSIKRDGPKATLFAFSAVVLLVIVLFRKISVFTPVILALTLGVLWMGGFIMGFWFKINFLNFIALPITFGIGVDYAVNIFSRYREEGDASLGKVIRDTGGAVLLCSFTTVVGYGSLLIASNQAFVSFGWLAVIGELTCLLAAVFSLPAILHTLHQRREAKAQTQAQKGLTP